MDRRSALAIGAGAVIGAAIGRVWAQGYPSKPVTFIVPFAPGGSTDMAARALAIPLAEILGQPVVIDNRTGAGGAVGTAAVSRAVPDGHTLLLAPASVMASLPLTMKTPYKRQDFIPVSLAAKTSLILVTRAADTRFRTLEELAALSRSQEGRVSAGNPAPGSPNHIGLLQLEQAFKCKFNSIPYRGSAPALADLLGGTLDIYFDQISSSMQHLKAGTLRALVVFSPTRDPSLPELKTSAQLGLGEIDATTYTGVFAPKGTKADVVARLNAAIKLASQNPVTTKILTDAGSVSTASPAAEFERIIKNEEDLVKGFIKEGRLEGVT